MKKFAKVIAGIAAPLFLIGGVLTGIGWYMGADTHIEVPVGKEHIRVGWDGIRFSGWNSMEEVASVEKNMELEPFTRLEVNLSAGNVTVTTGETYGMRLRDGSVELKYALEDGVLKVWNDRPAGVLSTQKGGSVEIFLPDGAALTDADIASSLGSLTLDGLRADNLTATADLGEVNGSELRVDSAVLTLNCGSLSLTGIEAGELEAELAMGNMTATGMAVADRLTVTGSTGSFSLEGELGEKVSVTADLGDISVKPAREEQWYEYGLSTDLGQVMVNGRSLGTSFSQDGEWGSMELSSGMGDVSVQFP